MLTAPFYDPLSERWIRPRPEKIQHPEKSSFGEMVMAGALAVAKQAEANRIWAITRQVAEGCNISPRESGEIACQD